MKIHTKNIIIYSVISLFTIICTLPFLILVSVSFSSEESILEYGYRIFPKEFSLEAYNYMLMQFEDIFGSYSTTGIVTIVGTFLSVLITIMTAYPLSRKSFKYRNYFNFYFFFVMLFNGGLVPWYIVVTKYYHLGDNLQSLIIPYLLNVWFIFLLRNFFSSIHESIEESAKLDGAGNFRILFQIMLPLSRAGIATVGLFIALMYWNDWWLGLMLINGNKFVPIQLYLMRIMSSIQFLSSGILSNTGVTATTGVMPLESARMAICVLVVLPIVIVYPFFQQYFVRGITVGAVKG
jgi:putative aldouronate transport system permease protein